MNRNWLIGIIIVVLVILGIWYFAGSGSMSTTGDNATSTATTTGSTTGTTGGTQSSSTGNTNTFRSIFSQDGNTECVYDAVGATTAHNIIRIADGKMYGEFRTATASGSAGTFMIYSGGTLYVWREGASTGKKTTIRSIADLPEAIPADLSSDAILGASGSNNVGWNCHPWAKDANQFSIPTYVKFS